jgi:hypothetical protein
MFPQSFPWADDEMFRFARAAGTYPSPLRCAPARFRVQVLDLDDGRTTMRQESFQSLAEARAEASQINGNPRLRAKVLAL